MIQLQFINYLLSSRDTSLIEMNNLSQEYFGDYKNEINFILNHKEKYHNIPDIETFVATFPDFEVVKVNEKPQYLIEELFKDYKSRSLAKVFNEVRKLLMSGKVDEATQLYQKEADNFYVGVSLSSINILEDTTRYEDYIERTQDFGKYYISTGFKELDQIIGGWDKTEELATIVARTNYGKCNAKGTLVLMADGSTKKVEDIVVGDQVRSIDSVNTVLGLHSGKSKGYKIIPTLGEPFTVSENHIMTFMKRNSTWNPKTRIQSTDNTYTLVDIMIEDFLELSKKQQRMHRL